MNDITVRFFIRCDFCKAPSYFAFVELGVLVVIAVAAVKLFSLI